MVLYLYYRGRKTQWPLDSHRRRSKNQVSLLELTAPLPDSTNAREILSDGAHEIEGENIIIILIMTAKTKYMFTSVMVSF